MEASEPAPGIVQLHPRMVTHERIECKRDSDLDTTVGGGVRRRAGNGAYASPRENASTIS